MSAASCLLTEDQFLCAICLDVFTDPVAMPCGHNFCKTCITDHWDINVQCQCPNCKEVFDPRPHLRVNTFISEMSAQFRQSAQQIACSSRSEQQVSKSAEVPCDVCTGSKLKALKSCLVCLVSYCETHLEHHLTASRLKTHHLIDPVDNLEGRMCTKHDKLLELFCKIDQMCVCMLCTVLDHKMHDIVPLKEGYEGKKAELEAEIQQMIQKRRLQIQEIKRSVELSEEDADREKAEGIQVFTALKESIDRIQAELFSIIKEKQRTTEKQAEGFIKELEQEISELKKRSTEVEQLSQSEDHLQFLQSFTSQNAAPCTKDWTEVNLRPSSHEGTVRRAVSQLEETLNEEITNLFVGELKRVQQYAVDVTLDPDTAHFGLTLSDDGKQVKHSDVKKNLPDNPKRFFPWVNVLAKQSFSSGRFYYEVQVKGKTHWTLGVASELINRKGEIILSPQTGYWTTSLANKNEYYASAGPDVRLSLKSPPQKEANSLQWELSFNQVQMKKSQQSWEQKYNRIWSENKTLTDKLEEREREIQKLRAEHSTLSRQCVELLSMLSVKEQRTYQETKPHYSPERDASLLELAVLGACRCLGAADACLCSRAAASSRKQLVQLQQELDAQRLKREEAWMVADAFRIAFEQQLRKRSEHFLLLAEANILKSNQGKAEGANSSPLISVSQRLRGLLPSKMPETETETETETLYRLLDLLNDKEEALAHQRKVSIMLAHSADELQRQLHLDSHCRPADPSENQNQQTSNTSESKIQAQVSSESNIHAQQHLQLPDSQHQPGHAACLSESRTEPQELLDPSQSNSQPLSNHKNRESEIQKSDQPES
ncbi:coiled-coil domain-containing protein 125 isoform X1 [Perca flavescens]|uniref:coiled-coil domain-containing protein 125 isoform X1 n=1 Tax=Perca flavescens TaxID=8167 RepID=UPI00106E1F47|nr:coiled-coil domain-containing protein 125 isoform X1 [Perca flavescens]